MLDCSKHLAVLPKGTTVCVLGLKDHPQAIRLREMGIIEGQQLEVLCAGDPMICRVGDCRVGICAKLASEIRVGAL